MFILMDHFNVSSFSFFTLCLLVRKTQEKKLLETLGLLGVSFAHKVWKFNSIFVGLGGVEALHLPPLSVFPLEPIGASVFLGFFFPKLLSAVEQCLYANVVFHVVEIVNLHYMLSKAVIKARPSVLWCYKDKLELSRWTLPVPFVFFFHFVWGLVNECLLL